MPVPRLVPATETPAEPVIRTLLVTDLVDSTRMVETLGDAQASAVSAHHDRAARDLLFRFNGLEIDKTDGFLLLFERPIDAVGYALAYHQALSDLSRELSIELEARVGIHLGEVLLRENSPADVAHGAKRLEVEGIAKPTAARVMSLAGGNQTLLTHSAFDLARRSAVGTELPSRSVSWLAHGSYRFKGIEEPMEIYEAGAPDLAPLSVPPDSEKAHRVVPEGDEITLGWRPAPDQKIPLRPNWILVERLGVGGFGEVWLAGHKKTSEKRVFKFCYEARRLRSLQREATLFRVLKETLGQRDDIARILDWNFDQAPYFLELEYTEGGSLIEWAQQQGGLAQVPLATRLELVAQAAEALAAAHSVGVLHKDVKPSNVLVRTGRDREPRARLTDFGIGRVMDESVLSEQGITVLGLTEVLPGTERASTSGTQLYMAPELLEGKAATVQADIYALGVMLYQMVVGDFSRALAPGWRRDVPDEILARDIAQMVDGSPERRPSSAQAAAGRLRRLEERRAAAHAAEARARAHRRWKLFASFGALASLILVIVSVLAVQATRAHREAERRRGQAEGLIGFMLTDLRQKLRRLGRSGILEEVGDRALEYFASVPVGDLSDDEVYARSRALMQIGQLRVNQGRPDDARAAFEDSLALVEGLVKENPRHNEWQGHLGIRHYWIGKILWDQGDLDGALQRFEMQLAAAQHHAERDPINADAQRNLAYAHNNIGFYLRECGELEDSIESLRRALEIKQVLLDQDPENGAKALSVATGHNAIGSVLLKLGDSSSARASFLAEQAIAKDWLTRDATNTQWLRQLGVNHMFISVVLEDRGDGTGARQQLLEGLSIFEGLVAVDPTNTGWQLSHGSSRRRLGLNFMAAGDLEAALEQAQQSVGIMEELVAKDPSRTHWQHELAFGNIAVGEIREAQGGIEDCRRLARSAIAILKPLIEKDERDHKSRDLLGRGYILLGRAHSALGDGAGAMETWRRAATVTEPLVSTRNPKNILTHAQALRLLGREDEAARLETSVRIETQRR